MSDALPFIPDAPTEKCPVCLAPLMTVTNAVTGKRVRVCFTCYAQGKTAWPS